SRVTVALFARAGSALSFVAFWTVDFFLMFHASKVHTDTEGAATGMTMPPSPSGGDDDHPGHAEAVGDHPEPGGEECPGQRHVDLPAVGQGGEPLLGLGVVGDGQRQRDALEARLPLAAPVGRHDVRLADAEAGVHHLVLGPGAEHALVWAVLE